MSEVLVGGRRFVVPTPLVSEALVGGRRFVVPTPLVSEALVAARPFVVWPICTVSRVTEYVKFDVVFCQSLPARYR